MVIGVPLLLRPPNWSMKAFWMAVAWSAGREPRNCDAASAGSTEPTWALVTMKPSGVTVKPEPWAPMSAVYVVGSPLLRYLRTLLEISLMIARAAVASSLAARACWIPVSFSAKRDHRRHVQRRQVDGQVARRLGLDQIDRGLITVGDLSRRQRRRGCAPAW